MYGPYSEQEREITWAVEGGGHIGDYARLLHEEMRLIVVIGKIFMPVWMLRGCEGFAEVMVDDPALIAEAAAREFRG